MTSAALAHDAFAPRRPAGMRSGFGLALAVHVLLVLALAWGVRWKASEPEGVVAELWSVVPQIAAPRPVAPPPPEPKPRPVEAKPAPTPPQPKPAVTTPPVDAQIAIEREKQKKREQQRREEEAERLDAQKKADAQKKLEARRAEQEKDRQRVAAEEQAEKKKLAEQQKKDEARQAAIREANLKRMMSQAGSSDEASTNTAGTAARSSGPSASYAGRIKARIKPNIVLTAPVAGNPSATVEVRVAPDGTIVGRKLVASSGVAAWDETVLRAIDKTEVLPKDVDGRVPPTITIAFRPLE